jgi:hypothetical protein
LNPFARPCDQLDVSGQQEPRRIKRPAKSRTRARRNRPPPTLEKLPRQFLRSARAPPIHPRVDQSGPSGGPSPGGPALLHKDRLLSGRACAPRRRCAILRHASFLGNRHVRWPAPRNRSCRHLRPDCRPGASRPRRPQSLPPPPRPGGSARRPRLCVGDGCDRPRGRRGGHPPSSARTIFAPATIALILPKATSRGRYLSPQSGATTTRSIGT